eukprot:CAMPEP_0119008036 /NCGR_PEP_ID=MMETSP1176-20130426/3419_1 /TAXON_ID=265551 /ORGANISM="Synedropsis recta cf, Strain CCMP1620" /LENGTH=494 /DNA_ID=CAMNT_0006960293 /DNA_START=55 /DNA_END=1539 /DNA_ORIENTATION=+
MKSFLSFVFAAAAASSTLPVAVNGFCPAAVAASHSSTVSSTGRSSRRWRLPFVFATTATSEEDSTSIISPVPPSWDELSDVLLTASNNDEETPTPLVTLYRDTNGWCPFCERIWVALRAKGIPYRESLVSLQNKPDWYKELVPTGLVPAVLFHEDVDDNAADESSPASSQRRIVWESASIMTALDEAFPDTPRMVLDTPAYKAALELNGNLQTAGFRFIAAVRNATLEPDLLETRREEFVTQLDELDAALLLASNDGPFCLGAQFSGLDCIMIPTLERWRHQLPLTCDGFDILENRPALAAWFDAMDAYAPYSHRVAGDAYSWTAATSTFLRYFGGGEDKPEVKKGIQLADAAAERMTSGFAEQYDDNDVSVLFAQEAAAKLISNHEAVVKDCTRQEPVSQKDIVRAEDASTADTLLRYVTSVLLSSSSNNSVVEVATSAPLLTISSPDKTQEAALAARTVAARLCVPRDMSAPAAKVLRYVLVTVAGRLEEEK